VFLRNLLARQIMQRTSEVLYQALAKERDCGDVGGSTTRVKKTVQNPYQKLTTQLMMLPTALAPRACISTD